MSVHDTIAAERLALAERLRGLDPEQWATPSLCQGWTVRDVLGHLVTPFLVGGAAMSLRLARHRSIARAFDATAREIAQRPVDELLDTLAANATTRFHPPTMPFEAPLTDIIAHGADIRWPLGDAHTDHGDPARLRPSLDFLVGPKARLGFVPKGRLAGVRLVASDQDWSHGEGDLVEGPSVSLIMACVGRGEALGDLRGAGVILLAAR